MFFILSLLFLIGVLYLIYKNRDQDEELLGLKLFGYYILGSFLLNIFGLPIPLGFLIYLIAFRPKVNASVKKYAAIFGLIMLVVGLFV